MPSLWALAHLRRPAQQQSIVVSRRVLPLLAVTRLLVLALLLLGMSLVLRLRLQLVFGATSRGVAPLRLVLVVSVASSAAQAEEDAARESPIAEGVPVLMGGCRHVPPPDRVARCAIVERVVGTLIDVVGTNANNHGRACSRHSCCGAQVMERVLLAFCREQLVFREGREEDVIAVYLCEHGVMTCKVGFLPAHLNRRARDYDGLVARVIAVYTDRCTNVVKRQKFWRNKGCCTARIVGEIGAAAYK